MQRKRLETRASGNSINEPLETPVHQHNHIEQKQDIIKKEFLKIKLKMTTKKKYNLSHSPRKHFKETISLWNTNMNVCHILSVKLSAVA